MISLDEKIQIPDLYKAFKLIRDKKFSEAESLLLKLETDYEKKGEEMIAGAMCSTLGLLYKAQKEYRKAWKIYDKAEKKIPDDPSLKIINARLLIEYFAQYDTVIKKMGKAEKLAGEDFSFLHVIYTLTGVAYLKKGNTKKAVDYLKKSMGNSFAGLGTSANFEFKLFEEMTKKKLEPKLCLSFLSEALSFAKKKREKNYAALIQIMIDKYPIPSSK